MDSPPGTCLPGALAGASGVPGIQNSQGTPLPGKGCPENSSSFRERCHWRVGVSQELARQDRIVVVEGKLDALEGSEGGVGGWREENHTRELSWKAPGARVQLVASPHMILVALCDRRTATPSSRVPGLLAGLCGGRAPSLPWEDPGPGWGTIGRMGLWAAPHRQLRSPPRETPAQCPPHLLPSSQSSRYPLLTLLQRSCPSFPQRTLPRSHVPFLSCSRKCSSS